MTNTISEPSMALSERFAVAGLLWIYFLVAPAIVGMAAVSGLVFEWTAQQLGSYPQYEVPTWILYAFLYCAVHVATFGMLRSKHYF